MDRSLIASLGLVALVAAPASAQRHPPLDTLRASAAVLAEFRENTLPKVPTAVLTDAEAVAVIPRVVKGGFVFGGLRGHGLVMTRGADGTWGDPTFLRLTGASVGFQAGVEASDVVLIIRSRKSVERLLDGKRKLTLGADVAVAAGPVGREAGAGTDARLEAEIYAYSRNRGLFAGVSLSGAVVANDEAANRLFARPQPAEAEAATKLKIQLTEMIPVRATSTLPPPPAVVPDSPGK